MPVIDEAFLAGLKLEPVVEEVSADQSEAFSRIVRLTAVRERCSCELEQRLLRDGMDAEAVRHAIRRALACGLVDDLRYADILVRSRVAQGKGRAGIEEELASSGIAAASLPGWPEAYFPEDGPSEEERAYEVLCRKPPRSKNVYASACRKLASRGFSADAVFSAARRYAFRHAEGNRVF